MYMLKERTIEMASFTIGVKAEEFVNLDFEEEILYVNRFTQEKCAFRPEEDERITGRGNPLLARNEFLTMDEVNKALNGE